MLTVAFYTAIHAVEALFFKDSIPHGGSHDDRNRLLKTRARYASIWKAFRPLYEASIVSRYDCYIGPMSSGWIAVADVRTRFVGHNLYEVERLVIKLLTLDAADYPPIRFAAPATAATVVQPGPPTR
jgi:hypothetical protein